MTALLFIGLVAVIAALVFGALRQATVGWPLSVGVALVYAFCLRGIFWDWRSWSTL